MSIRVKCSCGWKDQVKSAFAGQEIRCGDCGKRLTVPRQDEDDADEAIEVVEDMDEIEEAAPVELAEDSAVEVIEAAESVDSAIEVVDDEEAIEVIEEKPARKVQKKPARSAAVVATSDVEIDEDEDEDRPARRPGASRRGRPAAGAGSGSGMLIGALLLLLVLGGGGGFLAWYLLSGPETPTNHDPITQNTIPPIQNPIQNPNPNPNPNPMADPDPKPIPEPVGPWKGHLSPIVALGVTGDGIFSAAGGTTMRQGKVELAQDNTVRRWQMATGAQVTRQEIKDGIAAAAFSPDGKWAALALLGKQSATGFQAGANNEILLWDLGSMKEARRLKGHEGPVLALAFSPDSRQLLSGGGDKMVRLWDIASGTSLAALPGHDGAVQAVAFSKDGKQGVSGGADRTVRLWNLVTRTPVRVVGQHKEGVFAVAFLPDGTTPLTRIVSGGGNPDAATPGDGDFDIRLWDADKAAEITRFKGHEGRVTALAVEADGRRLLSASADGTARLWQIATGKQVFSFSDHAAPVLAVAFAGGNRAVSAGADKEIRLWNLPVGLADLVQQLKGARKAEAIAALGQMGPAARPAVKDLLALYKTGDAPLRTAILAALKPIGPPDAAEVATLRPLLEEEFPAGRQYALETLRTMGPEAKAVLAAVLACARDKNNAGVRKAALAVVAKLGVEAGDKAFPVAVEGLRDSDAEVIAEANKVLAALGTPGRAQLGLLRTCLKDSQIEVRQYALKSLEAMGRPAADPAVGEVRDRLLKDTSKEVRRQALAVMLKLEPATDATRMALETALTDGDPEVAHLAIDALARIPLDKKLVGILLKALESEDLTIRQKAQAALTKGPLTRVYVPQLLPILNGRNKEQQKLILALLAAMKAEAAPAVPALVDLLKDGTADLRKPIIAVLKGVGTDARDAGPALKAIMFSEPPAVQLEIAELLVLADAPEAEDAMPLVVKHLKIPDGSGPEFAALKEQATALLIKLGPRALKHLTKGLSDLAARGAQNTPDAMARAEARLEMIRLITEIAGKKKIPGQTTALEKAMTDIEGNRSELQAVKAKAKEARVIIHNAPQ